MVELLQLDDPECLRTDVAGAKAAGLAAARQRGLPVLEGNVVPADAAVPALQRGAHALPDRGSGGARLAVTEHGAGSHLLLTLCRAVSQLGPPVIVRSSADVERDGRWSGAFGSLPDITPSDIGKAVSSCWASVFRPDTLTRLTNEATAPEELHFAVLIQPQLRPVGGGTARLGRHATAEVTATRGPLAGLLSGWETGVRATRGADGSTQGDATLGGLGRSVLDAVDELLRTTANYLGDRAIEWAWADGRVVLLQTMPGDTKVSPEPSSRETLSAPEPLDRPYALTIAQTVHRYMTPPADELVLPWAIGQEDPYWPEGTPVDAATARSLADELVATVWGKPPAQARTTARDVLRQLRGSRPGHALKRIARLNKVPQGRAATLVATCDQFDERVRTRQGPGRWEPFLHGVVLQQGFHTAGTPAAAGVGAGMVSIVRDPHDPRSIPPRTVLVSAMPVPALAPRLWRAAGLVTSSGSPGAHLFEVARSLGVPAVIVPNLLERLFQDDCGAGFIMAVEGTNGEVAWVARTDATMVAANR